MSQGQATLKKTSLTVTAMDLDHLTSAITFTYSIKQLIVAYGCLSITLTRIIFEISVHDMHVCAADLCDLSYHKTFARAVVNFDDLFYYMCQMDPSDEMTTVQYDIFVSKDSLNIVYCQEMTKLVCLHASTLTSKF